MSYQEALEDGIEIIETKSGRVAYSVKCEGCGRKMIRYQYSRKMTFLCDYCKKRHAEKIKALFPNVETKYDKRFNTAVKNIQKQVKNFDEYNKAIKLAKTRSYKYASVPEAMTAIELLKNNYKIIPQQNIDRYKVDFVLKDEKIVLEIDGSLYHSNSKRENLRDIVIQQKLGYQWTIIHIPSDIVLNRIAELDQTIKRCYKALRNN